MKRCATSPAGQCDYVFGAGTAAALAPRNARFNARFGRADPRAGAYPDASSIFYLDFSDDPWAEASVKRAPTPPGGEAALSFCLTTCDGCGHCGAGVPANLTACSEAADRFVAALLDRAARVGRDQ